MQYIEYLEKQIDELNLSNVILTMIYKSYIITGMGIIELLFTYMLNEKDQWNTSKWKEMYTLKSNAQTTDRNKIKSETTIFKEVEPYKLHMDLDSMIKRIENKKIITTAHSTFPALKRLRELRNRVHLQIGKNGTDHDYNNFGFSEIQMMRRILYAIVTSPEICAQKDDFEFINESYTKNCAR